MADWVNYITPVPAAQPILIKRGSRCRQEPAGVPDHRDGSQAHQYYTYKNYNDFQAWNNTFNPIIQSYRSGRRIRSPDR